jgi:hypothetical protein
MVLEDLGSGHQEVLISILLKVPTNKPNTHVTWNFKKANWTKFQDQTETELSTINTDVHKKCLKHFAKLNRVQKKIYPEANHISTSHSGHKN